MHKREHLTDDAFEDVEFDPFISPDELRQKSSDEFRKSHDEQMQCLTRVLEMHGQLLQAIHEHLSSPKKIIRDQQGRAVGMEAIHNKGMH